MSSGKGWIGVDFDGTLAEYHGWKGAGHVGEPIPAMVHRVKEWIAAGEDVRIFTARISHDGTEERKKEAEVAHAAIRAFCLEHLGTTLRITNVKDYMMSDLWDDRAVQVIPNTGESVKRRLDFFEECFTNELKMNAALRAKVVEMKKELAELREVLGKQAGHE